ncbi:hypothetical protein CPC08DRAFT_711104 [Agrocybe pediades]|nr:hypothetical protein CPC08DRAFT_711104 [Agrocybe pediades]
MSLTTTNSLLNVPNPLPVKATFDTRTSWDIIRSCLATLFACLWVSVHPNMSPPSHSDKRIFLTKVELMIWTLLFPEMIILWAFRQWLGARTLSKEFKDYGWTMSHGFFMQMGGFVETSGEGHIQALLGNDLFKWIHKRQQIPKITSQQISGRSKGDSFSKAIIIAQTSWFVAQCIGRHVKGLFITPAELSTLAYAVLNGVMYFLWWHKPLDCRTPVELNPGYATYTGSHYVESVALTSLSPSTLNFELGETASTLQDVSEGINHTTEPDPGGTVPDTQPVPDEIGSIVEPTPEVIVSTTEVSLEPFVFTNENRFEHRPKATKPILIQLRSIFLFPYRRLANMRTAFDKLPGNQFRMFYAYRKPFPHDSRIGEEIFLGHILLLLVCLIFGGVHVLAWSSEFSSYTEHLLWRICSVAITALPMIYGLPILLLLRISSLPEWFYNLVKFLNFAIPTFYFIARLFLLIEMMISFRNLPSSAFVNVSWTAYFPHV